MISATGYILRKSTKIKIQDLSPMEKTKIFSLCNIKIMNLLGYKRKENIHELKEDID